MADTNLGRVQGASVFKTTASSSTAINISTLTPSNIQPLPGDGVLFPNGDLRAVISKTTTVATLGDVLFSLKGADGGTGLEGLGIWYTSATVNTSTTSILISSITIPTGRSIKPGDLIIGNSTNAYLFRVSAADSTSATVSYLLSLRGPAGSAGQPGTDGTSARFYSGDGTGQDMTFTGSLFNPAITEDQIQAGDMAITANWQIYTFDTTGSLSGSFRAGAEGDDAGFMRWAGDWVAGTNAKKGEVYAYNSLYYVALQDNSVAPVQTNNVNWRIIGQTANSVYKTNSTGTGALYPLLSQNASVGFGQPVQDLGVKVQGRMLYDNRGLLASNSDLSETKGIVAAKLEFMGEWTTGLVEPNTLWEYNNMFWVAKNATEDAPSELSDDWQLLNTTAAGINVSPAGGSLKFYLLGTGTKGTLNGAVVRNLSSAGYEAYAQRGELYDKRGKVASESEVVAQVTAIDTSTTYETRTLTMDGLTSYSQLVGKRIRVEIPSAPAGTTYFNFQTSASTVNINRLGALPLYFRIGGILIQGASNNTAGSQTIASGSNVTGFPRPTWYELLYVPDGGGRFECTELISHMASPAHDGLMSSSSYSKLASIDMSKLNNLTASRWTGREQCDPDCGFDVSSYFNRDGVYLITLELMSNGSIATYASVWMLYSTSVPMPMADIPAMKGSPVNADAENLLVTGRVTIDSDYQMKIWGTGAFDPATGQEDTAQDPSYALRDSYVTGIYFLCGM